MMGSECCGSAAHSTQGWLKKPVWIFNKWVTNLSHHWHAPERPFKILAQNQVLHKFLLILLLVFQHSLEILFLPGNVDWTDGFINDLSRWYVLHLAHFIRNKKKKNVFQVEKMSGFMFLLILSEFYNNRNVPYLPLNCPFFFIIIIFFSSTSLLLPTHHPPPSCTLAQSCNPMDCSLPGSSVHGLFQARILEWVAISFSSVTIFIPWKQVTLD